MILGKIQECDAGLSQVVTLYLTPVFYTYMDEFQAWLGRRVTRPDASPSPTPALAPGMAQAVVGWAEPDLDHAAALMRRIWEDPEEARRRGQQDG